MTEPRQPLLTGGCQCGAVRYALYAAPEGASICHCRMCQKAMGNVFAPLAPVRLADVRWTRGAPAVYLSSPIVERGFCRDCGTPLSFRYIDGDWIEIAIGSLDQPDRVPPVKHLGIESRLGWIHLADGLPSFRTEDNTTPDRLARIRSFQHPDHDTPDDHRMG
ncbi:MAG: GFA family protein [Rhodospirillales bacterium]